MNTLEPYFNAYVIGRWKRGEIVDATRDDYRHTLSAFAATFGNRPLRDLTGKAVDRWLETIGHKAPATRREYLSRVGCFLRWMRDEGHIDTDPTAHVPHIVQPRSVPVVFTLPQSTLIFDHVRGDLRATAMLELLFGAGARCVEVSRLKVEDYDPAGKTAMLTGKGMHQRTVPVTESMAEAFDAYLDSVGRTAGPFFRSLDDPYRGLSAKTISHYFRRWGYASGAKTRPHDGKSAHGARRTAGHQVMEQTGDIRNPQALLGHARLETTAKAYTLPVPLSVLRAAMESRTYRAEEPEAA